MFELSHAYHICEAHMGPYIFNGKLTDPGCDVVSWYVDQFPTGGRDQAREAADRLNMPVYDTIAGALTLYLDFINLFLFLLRFMGSRRD